MIYIIKLQNQAEWANVGDYAYLNVTTRKHPTRTGIEDATAFDDSVEPFEDVVGKLNFHKIYKAIKVDLYDIEDLVNL